MAEVVRLSEDFFDLVAFKGRQKRCAPTIIMDYLNGLPVYETAEKLSVPETSLRVISTQVKQAIGLRNNRRGLLKLVIQRGAEFEIEDGEASNFSSLSRAEWAALEAFSAGKKNREISKRSGLHQARPNVELHEFYKECGYRNIQHCVTSYRAVKIFEARASGKHDYFPRSAVFVAKDDPELC